MSAPPALEELTTLIQVLAEDEGLRAWFRTMEKVSATNAEKKLPDNKGVIPSGAEMETRA